MSQARINKSLCSVKREPDSRSESTSELLFGESVKVLKRDAGWCRVRITRDDYQGFIPTEVCELTDVAATHWLISRASCAFEYPDFKTRVVHRLLFGSEFTVTAQSEDEKYLQLDGGGYVWAGHCLGIDNYLQQSMIEIAQANYLHAPYLWGGRSTDGCDCSGLVQLLARSTGVNLPRDSGDQELYLTEDVEFSERTVDDLVYWPGHVGVLQSADTLLHATAHTMRCCTEPLQDVIQRAGKPGSIKRIKR